jgi:S1-C subfamily serine protease
LAIEPMGSEMKLIATLGALLLSIAVGGGIPGAAAQDWSHVHAKTRGSVLFVQTTTQKRDGTDKVVSTGTAFVFSGSGYALTVAHLVPAARENELAEYKVALSSREEKLVGVQVVKRDLDLDIALLRLPNTSKWVPVTLGKSSATPEGVPLYTLGFPRNSDLSGASGVLSSNLGPGGRWQTTLPLEHGNSGSPVLDIGGRVVAIASGGIDDAKQITFAVPIDYARYMLSMVEAATEPPTTSEPAPSRGFDFPLDITVGHEDAQEFAQEFCTPDGSKVKSWSTSITSQNGSGTRIISVENVPERPQCVRVRMYVAGNGVDRVAGIIVNYRGRGWLSGVLHISAE